MNYQSFQPNPPAPQMPEQIPPVQKTFTPKFIGVIVGLLVLGSGAYAGIWYWQNQQVANEVAPTFTPRPSALPDPTAGWKTYTDTQYGFEFKYPADWIQEQNSIYSPEAPKGIYGVGDKITVESFVNNSQLSIDAWRTKNIGDVIIKDNGPVPIAGAVAHQYIDGGMVNYIDTYIAKGSTVVKLGVSESTKYLTNYNQILSTFKFTDSADTSTWNTYTNTEYGIELKYPPTWKIQEKVTGFGFWINPPDFKMPSSGTVNPYFSFDVTAHMYLGDEKPVIKMFGTRTGYVYTKDQSIYFSAPTGAGGYFIKLYTPAGVDEPNQILSTFKFTK